MQQEKKLHCPRMRRLFHKQNSSRGLTEVHGSKDDANTIAFILHDKQNKYSLQDMRR